MKKKYFKLISYLSLCVFLFSCGKNIIYKGNGMDNYPDIKGILGEYLDTEEPIVYNLTINDNGTKTEKLVPATDMDWKEITEPFLEANIYDSMYDGKYNINMFQDSVMHSFTLNFTALDPELATREISIHADDTDRKIRSLYIIKEDPGFFTTINERLLFIPNSTIQIQTRTKRLFSKEKTKIVTYKF